MASKQYFCVDQLNLTILSLYKMENTPLLQNQKLHELLCALGPQILDGTVETTPKSQQGRDQRQVPCACVKYTGHGHHGLLNSEGPSTIYGCTAKYCCDSNTRTRMWRSTHLGWQRMPFINLDFHGSMDCGVDATIAELSPSPIQ